MVKFTIRHTFNTDVDTYWDKIFFDDAYNQRLYEDALGFGYEQVSLEDVGNGVKTRKVRTEPKAENIPSAMKRAIGDSLYYLEEGRFDPEARRWIYSVTTSKLAEKVRISGEFWVEPRGDKQIERLCTTEIEVKIFGVGKLIEGFVEKSTRDNYDKAAAFTNKWIVDHGL